MGASVSYDTSAARVVDHGTSVSSLYAARHSAAEGPNADAAAPHAAAASMDAATSGKWRSVAARQPCARTRPRKRLRAAQGARARAPQRGL
jgi:hypothetical protein